MSPGEFGQPIRVPILPLRMRSSVTPLWTATAAISHPLLRFVVEDAIIYLHCEELSQEPHLLTALPPLLMTVMTFKVGEVRSFDVVKVTFSDPLRINLVGERVPFLRGEWMVQTKEYGIL